MSKKVDERVVEMRFDNGQFEKNVATSMSTIEKLKQKLNLSGASKGLDDINSSVKKIDMSGLRSGIETVSAKFSALQVIGVTALANITNSAVNAGKRMISALTIDPVKDGLAEYETQMNAVQTILANTQKEGTNVKIVNKALDELNTYADKTIYNFTEMTRNIGTFTAAGVKLDTSVSAIKGIANLAAISGSNSQQASTAMYQLSQAIASGTVKLMDWNSVVNAGMGGQVFQDALIRTSEHLKTGAKAAIDAKGSFRESLQTGWMTTEVLTQTLDQFATAADTQQEYEAAVKKFVDQGYSKEQAKQMADMAKTAGEAATKVKTFTQLVDTIKEALGSGWAQTWRLIIGDFEEAKELWTGVSDVIGGFINKMSDARNKLLESALGKGFSSLSDKISKISEPAKKASETMKKTVDAVSKLGDVVDDVILGKFGNGKERFDALTESGINFYKVQNKVNEKLGNSKRYTDEQIAAQDKLLGSHEKVSKGAEKESEETSKLTDKKKELIKRVASMTEEQMRSKGYTDEQIAAFKELGDTADKLGMPLNEFIDNIDKITGRWLLINSFKNIGKSIITVFSSIGKAWRETFEPMSPDTLFNIIAAFHKFTATIKNFTENNSDELIRTFKGLFAILDIITTITGGGLKLAFKALSAILGAFNMDVLDLTAKLGDMVSSFRDFLFDNNLINKGFEMMASGIKMAVEAFRDLFDTVKNLPKVKEFIEDIKNVDLKEIGKNILEGLKNGLEDGINTIPSILIEIGTKILEAIKGVLGIHSPSTEMYEVGTNTIEGLVNGLKDGSSKVWEVISNIGSKMLKWIKSFDWSKAFALGVSVGLLSIVKKLVGTIDNFVAPLRGVGDVLSGVGEILSESSKSVKKILNNTAKVVKSFSKVLNAKAFQMKAEGVRSLAISLVILAGSVYLLAQLDTGKLWSAVGAISVLSVVLVALSIAMDKLSTASASIDKNGLKLNGLKTGLIGIGVALLIIAATVKVMSTMDMDEIKRGFIGLAGIISAIVLTFAAYGLLVKGKSAQNIGKAGKMLRSMAITMLLMVGICKLVGMLSEEEMLKGAAFAGAFVLFVTLINAASLIAGKNVNKIGGTMLKISIAMLLMIGVCKLVGMLSKEEMLKGAAFAGAFLIFVGTLVAITKIGKDSQIAKLGGMLLGISISMLLMIGVCKLVGMLSKEEMLKGAAFAGAFLIFVGTLVAITKIGSEEKIAKVAGTLIAMSVAIGIMAGVCILLGLISLPALAKGVAAVSILGIILALMIKATKGAEDVKGSIIAMSVAIAVMAVAVAALSFIDPKNLAGATIALSMLMGMFALMAKASGSLQGSMGSLIVMTVLVGLLAGIIYLLSRIPIESALGVATSLSVLLLSLSASCAFLSLSSGIMPQALVTIGVMALVVAALAGILYLIKGMDPSSAIGNATALSVLLLSLSSSCLILTGASLVAPTALIAIGVMTLVVAALAGILYLIRDMNPISAIGNATALSTLLIAMSACCVILTAVGLAGPAALIGVGSLVALVTAVGGLIIAIGALSDHFPKMEEFINKGIPILEKIGYALGSFFGNIIGGFAEGITASLPKMAIDLSLFMIELQPFIDGAKQVDGTALTGVSSLVKMVTMITGASLLESITSFVTGSSSMETFATQINSFADAIVSFSSKVKGKIDESSVLAAANAGKMLAEMTNAIPSSGGLFQLFSGEKNLSEFGTQLAAFGGAIAKFSESVAGKVNEEAVTAAASAGKIMTSLQGKIESTGGVVQWFTGEKNMATFGAQLVAFGKAITKFSENTKVDQSTVFAASTAGMVMATLQKNIPEKHWFDGKVSLSEFGRKIVSFGKSIKKYSDEVTGIDTSSMSMSISVSSRLISLTKRLVDLDTSGIKSFKDVKGIGESIKSYSDKVSKISIGSVNLSIKAANNLTVLLRKLIGLDVSGISTFKKVTGVGDAIASYSTKIASVNISAVSSSVSLVNRLVSMINNMSNINTNGVTGFRNSINSLSKTNVSGLVNAFSGSTSKLSSVGSKLSDALVNGFKTKQSSLTTTANTMMNAVQKLITSRYTIFRMNGSVLIAQLASGIISSSSKVTSGISHMLSVASSSIRSYHGSFYSAGGYLVTGFANGISSNSYLAAARAAAMASQAYQAAKKKLDINSPSKVFRRLGYSVPEGFAQGIDRMSKCVDKSSVSMAGTAIRGTEDALRRITNIISDDVDSQPTISPVVDLSDVKRGVNAINGYFNNKALVGVAEDVNAVSLQMNRRGQNGVNDDIVSAINKLRKDLENNIGPSYTVNGITYDDGTNVSEAIKSLVRAARIERRI